MPGGGRRRAYRPSSMRETAGYGLAQPPAIFDPLDRGLGPGIMHQRQRFTGQRDGDQFS